MGIESAHMSSVWALTSARGAQQPLYSGGDEHIVKVSAVNRCRSCLTGELIVALGCV
jgi:hypothetical protein